MKRKLFCEIHPITYKISLEKECMKRRFKNLLQASSLSGSYGPSLDHKIYTHKSLLLRKLGNTDIHLQENKKDNLKKVAPRLDGILIKPGETFSFWQLVGPINQRKGFKEGVLIKSGRAQSGIGGGMCQMTNLIHWMVLHSPLQIVEHHHHHKYDLFPDFKRQVPFGMGTSIMYNYLDYRFYNPTDQVFQLKLSVSDRYLEGELRSDQPLDKAYHIYEKDHAFYKNDHGYFRTNRVHLKIIDKRTGNTLDDRLVIKNLSQVMYDPSLIRHDIIDKTQACPSSLNNEIG